MGIDYIQAIILSLVQGVTEFLPISSSAHLIIFPKLMQWDDQGLAFDVAVHFGTLMAVVLYFKDTLYSLYRYVFKFGTKTSHLAWSIILGTIPVGIAGLGVKFLLGEQIYRQLSVISFSTIFFGLLLAYAAYKESDKNYKSEYDLTWKDVAIIGCAQALALIPGTSRSGITLTAALLVGVSRAAAARFSFMLSIPVIVLAFLLEAKDLAGHAGEIDYGIIAVAIASSFCFAYATISLFLRAISQVGLWPFIVYRMALGVFLLAYFV